MNLIELFKNDNIEEFLYNINENNISMPDIRAILSLSLNNEEKLTCFVNYLIDNDLYYLIDDYFFIKCLDNSFYNTLKLLIELNLNISEFNNSFLDLAIRNNDIDLFNKIITHENFYLSNISMTNFDSILSNDKFSYIEFEKLFKLFSSNINIGLNNKIESSYFCEKFFGILNKCIEYNKLEVFIKLYNLKETKIFLEQEPKYKQELLINSLNCYFIANYLFIDKNENIYLDYYESNIINFSCYNKDIISILLDREDILITKESLINATNDSIDCLNTFLNHDKITSFENLNFLLTEAAANQNHKVFNLLIGNKMTQITNNNYQEVLIKLIKSNNFEEFESLLHSDFMLNKSINEFVYEAAVQSKNEFLKLMIDDSRFTSINDVNNSPVNAILNKTQNSFNWKLEECYSCLKIIITNDKFKFSKEHILFVNFIIMKEDLKLFHFSIEKFNEYSNESYTPFIEKLILKSFSINKDYCYNLFQLKYSNTKDICTKLFTNLSDKNIHSLLTQLVINNSTDVKLKQKVDKFILFHENYYKFASVLFKDKNVKQELIINSKSIFDAFTKKVIENNSINF